MTPTPAVPPLVAAAQEFCALRGIVVLDLLEELQRHLGDILPDGCRVSTCGSCGRAAAVPTAESLREFRQAHGFTQVAVAKLAGCKRQHICQIEQGARTPSAEIVAAYQSLSEKQPEPEDETEE